VWPDAYRCFGAHGQPAGSAGGPGETRPKRMRILSVQAAGRDKIILASLNRLNAYGNDAYA